MESAAFLSFVGCFLQFIKSILFCVFTVQCAWRHVTAANSFMSLNCDRSWNSETLNVRRQKVVLSSDFFHCYCYYHGRKMYLRWMHTHTTLQKKTVSKTPPHKSYALITIMFFACGNLDCINKIFLSMENSKSFSLLVFFRFEIVQNMHLWSA